MKHYLLTNLSDLNSDDWLEVFEKFCYQSILRQKNKNFTWLVGIPHELHVSIWEKWADCMQFHNIILTKGDNFVSKALDWMFFDLMDRDFEDDHVVTTHVRFDQGLARNYVDVIQSIVRGRKLRKGAGLVINPSLGIYLNTLTKLAKQESLVSRLSPFVSLVEPREDFGTVLWYRELMEPFPVINIRDQPLWVRVLHRQNSVAESRMSSGKFRVDEKMFSYLPSRYLNQVVNTALSKSVAQKHLAKKNNRRKTIYNRDGRHVINPFITK